jgi:hypothetical protein
MAIMSTKRKQTTSSEASPRWGARSTAAIEAVKRVLAGAEETFLADSSYSMGTWAMRVQETLSVAARQLSARVEAGDLLFNDDVALEQAEVFADITAEAIRAGAHFWGECSPASAREEILDLLGDEYSFAPDRPGWNDLLLALAGSMAALEPVANALRDGDLPKDAAFGGSHGGAATIFTEVARKAYWVVYVLCA